MRASGVYSPVHRTSDIRAEDFGHRQWPPSLLITPNVLDRVVNWGPPAQLPADP